MNSKQEFSKSHQARGTKANGRTLSIMGRESRFTRMGANMKAFLKTTNLLAKARGSLQREMSRRESGRQSMASMSGLSRKKGSDLWISKDLRYHYRINSTPKKDLKNLDGAESQSSVEKYSSFWNL